MTQEPATHMQGKTVVITGATGGLGKETACEIARMQATVVGVGRNAQKCRQVEDELRRATGNPAIEYRVADLSSQAEIRTLADAIRRDFSKIDVLINNAGAFFYRREVTVDGLERTFALNHLAYFLLTNLLLDPIKAAAPSRIVNVSSSAHLTGAIHFDNLQLEGGFNGWRAYRQSKLANVLFSNELAQRLRGTGATSNALHPGLVATKFGHGGAISTMGMTLLQRLAGISVEEGAHTQIYLATSPEVEGVTGLYFDQCRPVAPAATALNVETARRLWDASEALTSLR